MKMTCTLPDHAAVVEALLEGFVLACRVCIEAGLAPLDPSDTNVRYQMEPPGQEDWVLPQNVMRAGWGDCEDLAGWRAAGMRISGRDPGARVVVVQTGKGKLHAVVQCSDGSISDPSLELRTRQAMMGGLRGSRYLSGPKADQTVQRDHRGPGPVRTTYVPTASTAPQLTPQQQATEDARARLHTLQDQAVKSGQATAKEAYASYETKSPSGRFQGTRVDNSGITDAQSAAAQGYVYRDGHYERMRGDEQQSYQENGYQEDGDYQGAADRAAQDYDDGSYFDGGGYAYGYGDTPFAEPDDQDEPPPVQRRHRHRRHHRGDDPSDPANPDDASDDDITDLDPAVQELVKIAQQAVLYDS